MTNKFVPAVACVCALYGVACADLAIYSNDFSVRTSSSPIPAYGVAHKAQAYPTGFQYFSGIAFVPEYLTGYPSTNVDSAFLVTQQYSYYAKPPHESDCDRPNYDGWVTPFFRPLTGGSQYKLHPTVRNDDGNNAFAWFHAHPSNVRAGFVLQSLHNTFTSGVLRIQVDMRPPRRWISYTGKDFFSCRVFPVYGKYMDPMAMDGNGPDCLQPNKACIKLTPGSFGVTSGTSTDHEPNQTFLRMIYTKEDGENTWKNFGYSYLSDTANTNWVRFVVSYDLDRAKHSGAAYFFGDDVSHPTFDTEPSATAYGSYTDLDFPAMTDEDGGISGLGIMGNGVFGQTAVTTNKVYVDNFRLSWKAPGAADFETFYENDFSNRWYKTLCDVNRGVASSGYAPATVCTNVIDSSTFPLYAQMKPSVNYITTNNYVPAVSALPSASQPVGYDGWRRLPIADGATAYFGAFYAGGSQYDRITNADGSLIQGEGEGMATFGSSNKSSKYAVVANPIGETYTSGKVRLSVDMRLPLLTEPPTFVAGLMRAAVGLGSTTLYSAPRADLAANIVAGCGYVRTLNGTVTNHVPYAMAPSTSSTLEYALETSFTEPQTAYWYRMEVAVDLDSRTYATTVTPLSPISVDSGFTPTNGPIYAKTGLPLASTATDVGTVYLRGFGYESGLSLQWMKGRVCFDNICVWRQATGAEAETLVYLNDFLKRTRNSTGEPTAYNRAVGYVANIYDMDDGPDHWIRRSVVGDEGFWATATVRDDGGNQFLALGRELESGSRVQVGHTFGESIARPFRFSIDVRPPSGWRKNGGFAEVSLGTAVMEQTEVSESIFNAGRLAGFGFMDVAGSSECPWVRPYMLPVARTVIDGVETNVALCAASAIATDHWYRFKVTVRPQDGVYGIRLYDMGTAHPVASSPAGALIGSEDGLAFVNELPAGEGVSAFNLHAYGVGGVLGEAGVDADNVMIDNIVAVGIPGTVYMLR